MLCILAKECSIFKYRETIAMSQVAAKLSKWYLSFFSAGLNIALLYLLQKTQSVSLWPKFSNFVQKSWDILSFSVSVIQMHKYLYLHVDGLSHGLKPQYTNKTVMRIGGLILNSTKFSRSLISHVIFKKNNRFP